MNFDKFDELLAGLHDDEKNTVEFAMAETAKFGDQFKDTRYLIPFPFINFSVLAESFMMVKHPAFDNREAKFGPDDFPELDYGADEDQPPLNEVFAEFLNMMYATIMHEHIDKLQKQELVDVTFNNGKFEYALKSEDLKEEYGTVIEYANIFL